MTKKQTRLEKIREKNVEIEQFPKTEEKTEESPEKEETVVEETTKMVESNTKTYLVKDILVGSR